MYYTKSYKTIDSSQMYNVSQVIANADTVKVLAAALALIIFTMLNFLVFYWYILRTGKLEDPVKVFRIDENNFYVKFKDYMMSITLGHLIAIYVVSTLLVLMVLNGMMGRIILIVIDRLIYFKDKIF